MSAVLPDLEISHIIPQDLRPDLAAEPGNVVLELVAELGGRNKSRLNVSNSITDVRVCYSLQLVTGL